MNPNKEVNMCVSISNTNTEGWVAVYVYVGVCRFGSRWCTTRAVVLQHTTGREGEDQYPVSIYDVCMCMCMSVWICMYVYIHDSYSVVCVCLFDVMILASWFILGGVCVSVRCHASNTIVLSCWKVTVFFCQFVSHTTSRKYCLFLFSEVSFFDRPKELWPGWGTRIPDAGRGSVDVYGVVCKP